MNRIEKFLRRLSPWERLSVESAIGRLISGNWDGLDIKKLRGESNLFRARKGDIRVIYRLSKDGRVTILEIGRRSDTTYNF